jgi:hexosaminidase
MPANSMSWNKGFPNIVSCAAQIPWSPYADEPPSGQLDPSNPDTYTVISALVNEMTQTFPDPYYHIGGDEVNFPCWQTNPNFNTWLQENNFTLGDAVNYFEQKVTPMVENAGKTVMVWQDIILQGAQFSNKENTIVQVWDDNMTIFSQMIEAGYNIVVSNSNSWYLDCGAGNFVNYGVSWCDPFKTWLNIYQNPVFTSLSPTELKSVVGGEVALWTEQTDDNNVETMIFPRIFGAAEPLWIGFNANMTNMEYLNILERLKIQRLRIVRQGIRAVPLQPTYCFMAGADSCPPT